MSRTCGLCFGNSRTKECSCKKTEGMDRRSFFASLGAALVAPLVPLKEKWIFNRSRAIAMVSLKTATFAPMEVEEIAKAIEAPLRTLMFKPGEIEKIFITNEEAEKHQFKIVPDSFESFTVNTTDV